MDNACDCDARERRAVPPQRRPFIRTSSKLVPRRHRDVTLERDAFAMSFVEVAVLAFLGLGTVAIVHGALR